MNIVVTDDRAARSQCSRMEISFTGIGILKAAFLDGQITLEQANDIFNRTVKEGFYSPVRSILEIV